MPRDDSGSAPVDAVFLNELFDAWQAAFTTQDAAAFFAMMNEDVVFEHSAAPGPCTVALRSEPSTRITLGKPSRTSPWSWRDDGRH